MAIAAGTVSRDQWIETMEPTLLELFTAGLENANEWKQCYVMKKSNKRREELLQYRKPDVVEETPEGSPYVQLTIEKVRTTAVVHADYTGMIRITHQMQRDKQYDDMAEQTWGLGESISRKMYEEAVRFLYEGFSTTGSINANDTVSLFSASHPLSNSSSLGNNFLNQALSPDALNNARVLLQKCLNENGKITPYGSSKLQLIVPAELERLALQLTMGEYEPGSNNYDSNVLKRYFTPICLPMLGMAPSTVQATQWYVRDPMKAKNICFMREGPTFDTFRDPYTDDVIVKARVAFSFLMAEWRGLVGCYS